MIDAVKPAPRDRPYIVVSATDSKTDISSSDRTRLVSLARKLWYNNSVIKGAIQDISLYSVGTGIKPQARTDDEQFNRDAEAYWHEWCKMCDVTGRMDFITMQRIVSETIDRDGEIFCILTDSKDGNYPQLQLIESHRVGTPTDLVADTTIVDGIKLSPLGRPVKYYILTGDGTHTSVKAEDMIHVTELERSDQVRGYPRVSVAINDMIDRDDLKRFEISSAKMNSALGLVISNKTGSVGDGFLGDINKSDDNKISVEDIFGGGMIPRIKTGESVESFRSDRPNINLIPFTDALTRSAMIGLGIPYEFVWDTSKLNGVGQRFILAKAARRFEARQTILINRFLSHVWRYVLAKGIKSKAIKNAPDNWWKSVWLKPRSISVDNGRDAAQDREDYKMGFRNLAEICGERGEDWQNVINQKISEMKWVKAQADQAGVNVDQLMILSTQSGTQVASDPPLATGVDDAPVSE